MLFMRRFKFIVPMTFVMASLVLGGCTADPVAVAEDAAKKATAEDATKTATAGKTQDRKRADVMGQVKSIVGNSVVIELAKLPTRDTTGSGQSGAGGKMPEGAPDGGPPPGGMPPEGAMPQGGTGGGSAVSGSGSAGSGTSTRSQRSFNLALTGETKEIMIPVGVSITSGMGDNGKAIDIADIEKGAVIMLYYAEGTEEIERIVVR